MSSLMRPYGLILVGACVFVSGCVSSGSHGAWKDPLSIEEHALLGDSYLREGQTKPAAREYRAIVARDPRHVPALMALGNIAFEQQEWGPAEDYYRRALEIEPNHPGAANNLAMVYLSAGHHLEDAERLARHALAQPTNLDPYIRETLASLYIKQERWQEARTVLTDDDTLPVPSSALRVRLAALRQQIAMHE